jgi:hypothetical protein
MAATGRDQAVLNRRRGVLIIRESNDQAHYDAAGHRQLD